MSAIRDFIKNQSLALLQHTLERLLQQKQGDNGYSARVWQALQLAEDLEYKAGVHPIPLGEGRVVLVAVIELPQGHVTYLLDHFGTPFELPTEHTHARRVREFLGLPAQATSMETRKGEV